jgi:predicted dehydrogenase
VFKEHYGCAAFASLATALTETVPDVVVIATPTPLHGVTLREVLERGAPSAILCEKPLSLDVDEARKMVALCLRRSCHLFVNYVRRSEPGANEVKRRLDEGLIQGPLKGVAWYSKGLFHNGSHLFNLLQYWFGEMKDFRIIESGRLWAAEDPEPDVQVRFDDTTVTFLAAKEEDFSHYTIELIARNGRLRYEDGGERIVWQSTTADSLLDGYVVLESVETNIHTDMARSQWHVLDQLASSLDSGVPAAICTGPQALRTLESLSTIRTSLCMV